MEKPLVNSRSNKLKTLKGSSPLLFSSLLKIGKPNLSRILTAFENRIWRCAPSFLMVNIGFSTPLKNGKNALFFKLPFQRNKIYETWPSSFPGCHYGFFFCHAAVTLKDFGGLWRHYDCHIALEQLVFLAFAWSSLSRHTLLRKRRSTGEGKKTDFQCQKPHKTPSRHI